MKCDAMCEHQWLRKSYRYNLWGRGILSQLHHLYLCLTHLIRIV
jgi:hypothetical protein